MGFFISQLDKKKIAKVKTLATHFLENDKLGA